jgi:hypothetical protein
MYFYDHEGRRTGWTERCMSDLNYEWTMSTYM